MTTPKKKAAAPRKAPAPVPGTVTTHEHADGWTWKWRSPNGTDHLSPTRFPTEAKALTAGRQFARRSA